MTIVVLWEGALLCSKNRLPNQAFSDLRPEIFSGLRPEIFSEVGPSVFCVEFRVNRLSFRYNSLCTIPFQSKKITNMVFTRELWIRSFCVRGEFSPVHADVAMS